jgi:hypothetical protein
MPLQNFSPVCPSHRTEESGLRSDLPHIRYSRRTVLQSIVTFPSLSTPMALIAPHTLPVGNLKKFSTVA